jgi:hypothetical protein
MGIWQDLVTGTASAAGTNSVKRFVGKLRGGQPAAASAVIVHSTGEEAQVDYGSGPMVRDAPERQVSAHSTVCYDTGVSAASRCVC